MIQYHLSSAGTHRNRVCTYFVYAMGSTAGM